MSDLLFEWVLTIVIYYTFLFLFLVILDKYRSAFLNHLKLGVLGCIDRDTFEKICFIIVTFAFCDFLYVIVVGEGRVPEIHPLQVIVQGLCFVAFSPKLKKQEQFLLLLVLFCAIFSTLFLFHKCIISIWLLSALPLLFVFALAILPYSWNLFLLLFCGYFYNKGLSDWGFYLTLQQAGYPLLFYFLESRDLGRPPTKSPHTFHLFFFLLLAATHSLFGYFIYDVYYFLDPSKISAIFSGAGIAFIVFGEGKYFRRAFTFLLCLSVVLALALASQNPDSRPEIFRVLYIHFFIYCWLYIFEKRILKGRTAPKSFILFLVSIIIIVLLYFGFCPDWLQTWLKDLELLLLFFGLLLSWDNKLLGPQGPAGSAESQNDEDRDNDQASGPTNMD